MNEAIDSKKEYKHWSKSMESDGKCKSLDVCEIENGFLITLHKSGTDKDDKYYSSCKKWYSKDNPLNPQEEKEEPSALDGLEGSTPMFETY